jgi:GntR family transcriptional repressor for pyruvate dehydrogenase complex
MSSAASNENEEMMLSDTRLRPVERYTLAQQVMQRLVEFVAEGGLKPGEALPSQHRLAERLGVSRPVLREAMQGLASIGFLEIRPGSGCYVGRTPIEADSQSLFEILTHEAALEAMEARMVVEVELAGLAAQRATAADHRAIEEALLQLRTAIVEGRETAEITFTIHRLLASAGHNAFLQRMSQLLDQARVAQFTRVAAALPDVTAGEYESHMALYAAIQSGDPDRARVTMREHLQIAHGLEERINWNRRQVDSERRTEPIDNRYAPR